jgi:hypothetical protein
MREERRNRMQESYRGGRATAWYETRTGRTRPTRRFRSPTAPGRPSGSVRGTAARPRRSADGSRWTGPAGAGLRPAGPSQQRPKERAGNAARTRASHASAAPRAPFILLVLGLLGGGLVCLLVINTTLGATSFKITQLQQTGTALAEQQQSLQQQVSAEEAPAQVEQRAYQLGMRPVAHPHFLVVRVHAKTGAGKTGTAKAGHRSERRPGPRRAGSQK